MNGIIKTPRYIFLLARKFRNNMTLPERLLWEELKDRKLCGLKFRNQHPVYRYILDFYCHEKSLAIEIDGLIHEERKDYDLFRDEFIKSIGIATLRIKNSEITENIE
jgi:very-short-patch-repair endonuclease